MRYALFSDIHSNLEAYEAVIAALQKERADSYFCCGDIVGYGADPVACINKTRELGPHIVAGNHDWGAAGLYNLENFTPNAKAGVEWTRDRLCEEDKRYLASLQLTCKTGPSPRPSPQRGEGAVSYHQMGEGEVVLTPQRGEGAVSYHQRGEGAVKGLWDFLLVHGSPNRPEEFEYVFNLDDAYVAFLRMQEDRMRLCFIGHTHSPAIFVEDMGYVLYHPRPSIKLQPEKRYIVNVGSVGQPRDNNPAAAYCIYDTDAGTIEIKRAPYDIEKAQGKIIRAGLPRVLAERLSLGK